MTGLNISRQHTLLEAEVLKQMEDETCLISTSFPIKELTYLLYKVLNFILQTPPLELDCYQFVSTHVWTICLFPQLLLQRHKDIHIRTQIKCLQESSSFSCNCEVFPQFLTNTLHHYTLPFIDKFCHIFDHPFSRLLKHMMKTDSSFLHRWPSLHFEDGPFLPLLCSPFFFH